MVTILMTEKRVLVREKKKALLGDETKQEISW
jgi:hypothetical protein